MKDKKSIVDFIIEHKRETPISFHVPGHKGRAAVFERYGFAPFVLDFVSDDITEIEGADNLHRPAGALAKLMTEYASLYGVIHSELLVNGGSVGVLAAILSSVPRGGKLIMARNSHRSAYNALRLGNIDPFYVLPQAGSTSIVAPNDIRDALISAPESEAVFVTSPTYDGKLLDIKEIARLVHAKGKLLIVDQAHGAHLAFFDDLLGLSRSAEKSGADLVIDSTHKTLLSMSGTGVLNICSDRVDIAKVSKTLSMLQTTSPSYVALGTLDMNARILRLASQELFINWFNDVKSFYHNCDKMQELDVLKGDGIDMTKINVSLRRIGISGRALARALQEQGIWCESSNVDSALLVSGLGNIRDDYEKLLRALYHIKSNRTRYADIKIDTIDGYADDDDLQHISAPSGKPEYAGIPNSCEQIPLYRAEGRVVYDEVTPYPPGIPLLCPGEVLTYEMIAYLCKLVESGDSVIGVDEEGMINVGK